MEDLPEEEEDFDDMEDLNMYDLIEEQQVDRCMLFILFIEILMHHQV